MARKGEDGYRSGQSRAVAGRAQRAKTRGTPQARRRVVETGAQRQTWVDEPEAPVRATNDTYGRATHRPGPAAPAAAMATRGEVAPPAMSRPRRPSRRTTPRARPPAPDPRAHHWAELTRIDGALTTANNQGDERRYLRLLADRGRVVEWLADHGRLTEEDARALRVAQKRLERRAKERMAYHDRMAWQIVEQSRCEAGEWAERRMQLREMPADQHRTNRETIRADRLGKPGWYG